jgi:3-oxoadipate enol-lactonase
MKPYLQAKFQVVLLDLVFQGQSDKSGEYKSFDQHAADVKHLIESLGLQKVNLCGISYGGMVAQHYAINYPADVQKLCLMATFAGKDHLFKLIETSWWEALKQGGFSLLFDVMMPWVLSNHYLNKPMMPIEEMKKLRLSDNADIEPLVKLMQATAERPDYYNKLNTLQVPTLVIAGEKDLLFTVDVVKKMADSIPGSEMVVIEDCGHSINIEQPEIAAEAILKFF